MTPEEKDLITSLFGRLRNAENGLQQDREAEGLIARQVAAQPAAPYQLTQTVLVQEHALHNAQQRIADLERQLAASREGERAPQSSGGGSFLSGLLGGTSRQDRPATPPPLPTTGGAVPMQASAPPPMPGYASTTNLPPSAGGGFLRSALATAAGVAGGSLLFQGIGNLLGHNAGPFSSFMGSGGGGSGMAGFAGGQMPMGGGNTETINNYYGSAAGSGDGGDVGSFLEGRGHHGGGGETVGDFADQSGVGGDAGSDFQPSDFDTNLPPDDGFQNLVDDNSSADAGGGFFDDGGGSSDDGTLV